MQHNSDEDSAFPSKLCFVQMQWVMAVHSNSLFSPDSSSSSVGDGHLGPGIGG